MTAKGVRLDENIDAGIDDEHITGKWHFKERPFTNIALVQATYENYWPIFLVEKSLQHTSRFFLNVWRSCSLK